MSIIDTLMRKNHEQRHRDPEAGFERVVMHPADVNELERDVHTAQMSGKSWGFSCRSLGHHEWVLPDGLIAHASVGVVQGWAIFEGASGPSSMTMMRLAPEKRGGGA